MTAVEDTLKGIGCDYITGTVREGSGAHPLHSLASELYRNQAITGHVSKPWGVAGFKGWSCGSVQIGTRGQELIVRLSSDSAYTSWGGVVQHADHISRMDVQATVRVGGGVTRRIEAHRRAARKHSDNHNKKPVVRWTADNRGGYTLYLGARQSLCFGRIYDKWQESKLDHYLDCVRYEVQFQDGLAGNVARALGQVRSPMSHMASYLTQFFKGRDIHLDLSPDDAATYCCSRPRSDLDKSLLWLRNAVRPSVERLINAGRGEEVLHALGLIIEDGPSGPSPDDKLTLVN